MIVLDASVIIKWFTREEDRENALNYREEFVKGNLDIVVPDLILYEISNALKHNRAFDRNDVSNAINSLFEMDIEIMVPTRDILNEALRFAFEYGITVYDGSYVAFAKELGCDFITADRKMVDKLSELDYVKLLG